MLVWKYFLPSLLGILVTRVLSDLVNDMHFIKRSGFCLHGCHLVPFFFFSGSSRILTSNVLAVNSRGCPNSGVVSNMDASIMHQLDVIWCTGFSRFISHIQRIFSIYHDWVSSLLFQLQSCFYPIPPSDGIALCIS